MQVSAEAGAAAASIGTIYGVLLNDRATVARLESSFTQPPYRAPPQAPILYIKSRNTIAADGCMVAIPASADAVRIDGTVGAVIGSRARAVKAANALDHVSGFVIVSDVTLPHDLYYRPAIRQRCRDGFCPMSLASMPEGFDVAAADVLISIDEGIVHRRRLSDLVRSLPQLLEEMTAFMTLEAGDVVLLGLPDEAPLARVGNRVRIEVPGLGVLTHGVVVEEIPA